MLTKSMAQRVFVCFGLLMNLRLRASSSSQVWPVWVLASFSPHFWKQKKRVKIEILRSKYFNYLVLFQLVSDTSCHEFTLVGKLTKKYQSFNKSGTLIRASCLNLAITRNKNQPNPANKCSDVLHFIKVERIIFKHYKEELQNNYYWNNLSLKFSKIFLLVDV